MRSPLEFTRFGLRILGLCLLLWCWSQIFGEVATTFGWAAVGRWSVAFKYAGDRLSEAFTFVTYDFTTGGGGPNARRPLNGLNWAVLIWYFRLALGIYLAFFNLRLARLLWRGISSGSRCADCGYDRKGLDAAGPCPECGKV